MVVRIVWFMLALSVMSVTLSFYIAEKLSDCQAQLLTLPAGD